MANFTHSFIDLAYAAGIVDGEGTIGITEIQPRNDPGKRKRKNPQHRIYIAVAMTDACIPLLLSEMFGGTIHTYEYNPGKHKPQTRWSLSGGRAQACCEALLPYLRLKGPQAELAIKFQKKHLSPNRGKKNTIPDQLVERRKLATAMRTLNAGVLRDEEVV